MRYRLSFSRQSGSSLIEVLISLFLVAVTMLGLLGLQLRALGLHKDSLDRRNAAVLAGAFADHIATNFQAFVDNQFDSRSMGVSESPPTTTGNCSVTAVGATCSATQAADREWARFSAMVRQMLPGGVAFVRADNTRAVITVGWLDPRRTDAESGGVANTEEDRDPLCNAVGITDNNYRCYSARVVP